MSNHEVNVVKWIQKLIVGIASGSARVEFC